MSSVPERASNVRVCVDAEEVYRVAAETWARASEEAAGQRGRFTVALAGGSTPRGLYEILARDPAFHDHLPWDRTHVFWGDERYVPPDHPDSNYRMVREALLARAPISASNVHPIPAELSDPRDAASAYERVLRAFFDLGPAELPRFDLVILGMGKDGHTASLFPGGRAARERSRLVVAERVKALGAWRITLTLPVLNAAARVVFLVSGEEKAATLATVLGPKGATAGLPAALVRPADGELTWLVDEAAAALLPGGPPERSP